MTLKGLLIGGMVGGIGGIFLGVLIGVAIFGGASFLQHGGVSIPYELTHTTIAEAFQVYDVTDGVALNCKHVITMQAQFHAFAPYDAFTPRETYTQSLWYWTTGSSNDIDVTMTIWGAGANNTYLVEFGRHAGNALDIKGFGESASWTQNSVTGYFSLLVSP